MTGKLENYARPPIHFRFADKLNGLGQVSVYSYFTVL
jgi:hypothetical protein